MMLVVTLIQVLLSHVQIDALDADQMLPPFYLQLAIDQYNAVIMVMVVILVMDVVVDYHDHYYYLMIIGVMALMLYWLMVWVIVDVMMMLMNCYRNMVQD